MHEDAHELLTEVCLHKSQGSKTLSVIETDFFTLANGLETQLQPSPRLQSSISIETKGFRTPVTCKVMIPLQTETSERLQ